MLLFKPTFLTTSLFVIFSKWADSSLSSWKIPNHLPLWSTFLCSLRYQASFHELLIPKLSAFFWTMGSWWDISTFVFCVHEHAPLSCPNPDWFLFAYLEDPRLLGVPRYPSPVPFWAPQQISLTRVGLSFLFPLPLFSKARTLPIHGFGPPPTYFKWTLIGGFGPCPFFEGPKGF